MCTWKTWELGAAIYWEHLRASSPKSEVVWLTWTLRSETGMSADPTWRVTAKLGLLSRVCCVQLACRQTPLLQLSFHDWIRKNVNIRLSWIQSTILFRQQEATVCRQSRLDAETLVRKINPENCLGYLQGQDAQLCARIATVSMFESKVDVFSTTFTCLGGSLATRQPVSRRCAKAGLTPTSLIFGPFLRLKQAQSDAHLTELPQRYNLTCI